MLLANRAEINAGSSSFSNLHAASLNGYLEIVTLLLANGADINAQGRQSSALCIASEKGYLDIVTLLLANGADVDAHGYLALHVALKSGCRDSAMLLLANGVDVHDYNDGYGETLQAAARVGNQEIVTLLLDKFANTEMQGSYNENHLPAYRIFYKAQQAASESGHLEIAKLLQQHART